MPLNPFRMLLYIVFALVPLIAGSQTASAGQATVRITDFPVFFIPGDGRTFNGPETVFYSATQARENCRLNIRRSTGVKVECRFDGVRFQS